MFLSQTQILTLQPLAALTKEFEKAKVKYDLILLYLITCLSVYTYMQVLMRSKI